MLTASAGARGSAGNGSEPRPERREALGGQQGPPAPGPALAFPRGAAVEKGFSQPCHRASRASRPSLRLPRKGKPGKNAPGVLMFSDRAWPGSRSPC